MKFKNEIDKSIERHKNLTNTITNSEAELNFKVKELAELESNFTKTVEQLRVKIESKKERNQELSRLIRIEKELNIEKEYNTKKDIELKIESTKAEFKETQSKLNKL